MKTNFENIYSLSVSHNQIDQCNQNSIENNDLGYHPCHPGTYVAGTWCVERKRVGFDAKQLEQCENVEKIVVGTIVIRCWRCLVWRRFAKSHGQPFSRRINGVFLRTWFIFFILILVSVVCITIVSGARRRIVVVGEQMDSKRSSFARNSDQVARVHFLPTAIVATTVVA